jgi:ubiquinol-cytochrome c reductase core subunit 2
MISRLAIGRHGQFALDSRCCSQLFSKRGFASAVSGSTSYSYDTSDVAGVKVAARDIGGLTTKLAVVSKAGTRYEFFPGLTTGLEQFAFKVRRLRRIALIFDPIPSLTRTYIEYL